MQTDEKEPDPELASVRGAGLPTLGNLVPVTFNELSLDCLNEAAPSLALFFSAHLERRAAEWKKKS